MDNSKMPFCTAITKAGVRCKNKVKAGVKLCHIHLRMAEKSTVKIIEEPVKRVGKQPVKPITTKPVKKVGKQPIKPVIKKPIKKETTVKSSVATIVNKVIKTVTVKTIGPIKPPPSFSKPNPYGCEGYWDDEHDEKNWKGYLPIVSKKTWPDKEKWLARLKFIEPSGYKDGHDVFLHNDGKKFNVIQYEGCSLSRIQPNWDVGCDEYEYKGVCWAQGYAEHYIGKYNVMPTERFYNFVNNTWEDLQSSNINNKS